MIRAHCHTFGTVPRQGEVEGIHFITGYYTKRTGAAALVDITCFCIQDGYVLQGITCLVPDFTTQVKLLAKGTGTRQQKQYYMADSPHAGILPAKIAKKVDKQEGIKVKFLSASD